jgi:hypothetical protein
MSGTLSDERSGLSFVLFTWTALVQFSKFAAGPRQHSIYLSVFITPGERVAQLYPQALGSSGTSGVPFPVPTTVSPWGVAVTPWPTASFMQLQNGPERKYHLIVVRCLATGEWVNELRPTVRRTVCLGVEPHLGLMTKSLSNRWCIWFY